MEILLTIILVIVIIFLLSKPKKNRQPYNPPQREESYTNQKPDTENPSKVKTQEKAPSKTSHQISFTVQSQNDNKARNSFSNTSVTTSYQMDASPEEVKAVVNQIFGSMNNAPVTVVESKHSTDDSTKKYNEQQGSSEMTANEALNSREKQRKEEERRKQRQQNKLKKELDEIIKFMCPEAEYDEPIAIDNESSLSIAMYSYKPYKSQYGMYERLLSEYPKKFSKQQEIWISKAIKDMLKRAAYIYYDNDDSIIEEYKYLSNPSHIYRIMMASPVDFPKLLAGMASWALYQCDLKCMHDMLSKYPELSKEAKREFQTQLIESLSRIRDEVFSHPLKDVIAVYSELQDFIEGLLFNDEQEAVYKRVDTFFEQGCSIGKLVDQIKAGKIWLRRKQMLREKNVFVFFEYPNGKQGDIDMSIASGYAAEVHEEGELAYCANFSNGDFEHAQNIIFLLFYHNEPYKFDGINQKNKAFYKLLSKYNNYHKLRDAIFSVKDGDAFYLSKPYKTATGVFRSYVKEMTDFREAVYEELIRQGETSAKWKSEQRVYAIACEYYPDAVYQYHVDWLGKQSLDVYIPSVKVGIEYQGLQHYEPVDYFGGEESYKGVVERDNRKRELCKANGIKLIYWKYDEVINGDTFKKKMNLK